jgi:N-acylglucosamine 2-epimerase
VPAPDQPGRPGRPERCDELIAAYRGGLLEDVLPFWMRHGVDREHGGIMTCLDRDGSVIDTDKCLWQQGRFAWLTATLCNELEKRDEWLDIAGRTIDFIRRHGFDDDGRMFYLVTRDGRPLRKRRYIFTETFAAAALAAYARASGEERAAEEARELFRLIDRHLTTPGLLEPKVDPRTRPMKGLAVPMVMLSTAQVLRDNLGGDEYDGHIDRAIEEIERDFMKPDLEAVLETVGPGGEVLDHLDGRILNPGHAIEVAWFILHEAKHRGGDERFVRTGTAILDWMWRRGWDEEYGGILYFRDIKGLPVHEYWQDMKFWWPHAEAIIATLLAFDLTRDDKYAQRHRQVHDWAHAHFPDPEHGEWFGYLHRDGRLSVALKGNHWKGPFHIPRMQLRCLQMLEDWR